MPSALQGYVGIIPACYTFQSCGPQSMHGGNALHLRHRIITHSHKPPPLLQHTSRKQNTTAYIIA